MGRVYHSLVAIPDNRLSTVPVQALYLPPDDQDQVFDLLRDNERGPIALSDPSQGQHFQKWTLTYVDPDFTLSPTDVGVPTVVLTAANVTQIGLGFDQNGHETICYNTSSSAFLFWFDSQVGQFVTTDLGSDVISVSLTLDDKRNRQTQANDVLLFYTKSGAVDFDLFYRQQRERYGVERLLATEVLQTIYATGMNLVNRVQISTSDG